MTAGRSQLGHITAIVTYIEHQGENILPNSKSKIFDGKAFWGAVENYSRFYFKMHVNKSIYKQVMTAHLYTLFVDTSVFLASPFLVPYKIIEHKHRLIS